MARSEPRTEPLGPELLLLWRADRPQKDVCGLLGLDAPSYSRIESGQTGVGLDVALRIRKATKGAVPVESWRAA